MTLQRRLTNSLLAIDDIKFAHGGALSELHQLPDLKCVVCQVREHHNWLDPKA